MKKRISHTVFGHPSIESPQSTTNVITSSVTMNTAHKAGVTGTRSFPHSTHSLPAVARLRRLAPVTLPLFAARPRFEACLTFAFFILLHLPLRLPGKAGRFGDFISLGSVLGSVVACYQLYRSNGFFREGIAGFSLYYFSHIRAFGSVMRVSKHDQPCPTYARAAQMKPHQMPYPHLLRSQIVWGTRCNFWSLRIPSADRKLAVALTKCPGVGTANRNVRSITCGRLRQASTFD